jgi:hypothetical protein
VAAQRVLSRGRSRIRSAAAKSASIPARSNWPTSTTWRTGLVAVIGSPPRAADGPPATPERPGLPAPSEETTSHRGRACLAASVVPNPGGVWSQDR